MPRTDISSEADDRNSLAEHVAAIQSLAKQTLTIAKQTLTNIIEIGRHLTECKKKVGTRDWGCWLNREFGWSERAGDNFMSLFELSKSKNANFAEIDLPVSTLYLLAAPSTPQPVRDEILERAEAGEKMTVEDVKATIAEAKPRRTGADRKQPTRKTNTRSETVVEAIAPVREENECTIEDTSGKNRKKISSKEARETLTIDALRDANARQMALINKLQNEKAAAQQDVGPDSRGELERKLARLAELENTTRRLEIKNLALENELKDLVDARKPASLIDALTAALAALEADGEVSKMAKAAISAIRLLLAELQKPVKATPVTNATPELAEADDASTYRRHATGRSTEENAIMNTDGEPPSNRWGNSAPTIRED